MESIKSSPFIFPWPETGRIRAFIGGLVGGRRVRVLDEIKGWIVFLFFFFLLTLIDDRGGW